jgi:outer membrane lipoprotein-sorting protein
MKQVCCHCLLWLLMLPVAAQVACGQQELPKPGVVLQPPQSTHALDPVVDRARSSLQNIQGNISDYSAVFAKRCRVGGSLSRTQIAKIKIRNPKSKGGEATQSMGIYVRFLSPSSLVGREVVWVDGKYEGKMIAHELGFKSLVNIRLNPHGFIAMRGQRRPLTDLGIENIAIKVLKTAERDRRLGDCEVEFVNNVEVGEADCTMVEVTHPNKRREFDFYRARVYFDNSLNIPVRYVAWSWPATPGGKPVLEEEYTYLRVKLNAGLTDQDFDIGNPEYGFR